MDLETQSSEPSHIDVIYCWDGTLQIKVNFDLAIPNSIAAMGGGPAILKQSLIENEWGITSDSPALFRFILRLCNIQGINYISVNMRDCLFRKHWLSSGDSITHEILAVLIDIYRLSSPDITYSDQPLGPPLTQADLDSLM